MSTEKEFIGDLIDQLNDLSKQLYNLIPDGILDHYADVQHLTKVGVCGMVIMDNPEWADRLFDDNALFSQDDVMHDFGGLISKDEHFVPRI